MQMKKILARIRGQLKAKGLTAAGVSRQATGSPDTIRNWERRLKAEDNPGASTATIEPIAKVLDVPVDWLLGNGPDDLSQYDQAESERQQIMEIVEALPASMRPVAIKQLSALVPSSEQEPTEASQQVDG